MRQRTPSKAASPALSTNISSALARNLSQTLALESKSQNQGSKHQANATPRERKATAQLPNQPYKEKKRSPSQWKGLPKELASQIFQLVQNEDQSAVARIMAVCSSWKQCVLTTPELWAQLIVEEGKGAELKARTFLRHSRNLLLKIKYIQDPHLNASLQWPAWEALKSSAERWKELTLDYRDEVSATAHIPSLHLLKNLKVLSISVNEISSRTRDKDLGINKIEEESVPNLEFLTLNAFGLPSVTMPWFAQLGTVRIVDQFDGRRDAGKPISVGELLEFFAGCPWLQHFSFESAKSGAWSRRDAQITRFPLSAPLLLPLMSRMKITAPVSFLSSIFEKISLPSLVSLELGARSANLSVEDHPYCEQIRDTIGRAKQLRRLRIKGFDTLEFLFEPRKQCLELLTCLELDNVPNLDFIAKALSSRSCRFLPGLLELKIDGTLIHSQVKNMLQMIESRSRSAPPIVVTISSQVELGPTEHDLGKGRPRQNSTA